MSGHSNSTDSINSAKDSCLAIKAGKIIPVTAPPIENGIMLVRNGMIEALGSHIQIPQDARILDFPDGWVYPGFIDACSHLGINKEPYNYFEDVLDGTDASGPFASLLHASDAFDPFSPAINRTRSAGITACCVAAGHGNIIDGQGICAKLRLSETASGMLLPGTEQVNFTLGDLPVRAYASKNQAPMTRMAVYQMLRSKFKKAASCKEPDSENWNNRKNWESGENPAAVPDEELAMLRALLNKKLRARFYCAAAQDIEKAVALGEEFQLDYTIDGALEAWKLPRFWETHQVPVVLNGTPFGPVLTQVAGWYDFSLTNAAVLSEAGCPISLTADEATSTALLPYMAGFLTSRGLPMQKALEAITIQPARVLGLEHRIGSLETGKDADFTIYSGNALVSTSKCLETYIEGCSVFPLYTL